MERGRALQNVSGSTTLRGAEVPIDAKTGLENDQSDPDVLDELDDIEFALEEIENKIAPLALA